MIRLMVLLVVLPALALAADDPIKAELDKARAKHAEVLDAARTKLVASLDAKLLEVAGKGDLEGAKDLKSQKVLFEKDGSLPKSAPMARVKADYESEVRTADEGLRKALETAKVEYTQAIKLDEASAVAEELKRNADVIPAKKGYAPAAKEKEPTVVATWAHQVGQGKDTVRSTFKLYSNGKINSPTGRATWYIKGGLLTLRWPDPKAPGGAWDDVVNLASDGKSYAGKNDKGTPIFGVKLASGDINAEKKK